MARKECTVCLHSKSNTGAGWMGPPRIRYMTGRATAVCLHWKSNTGAGWFAPLHTRYMSRRASTVCLHKIIPAHICLNRHKLRGACRVSSQGFDASKHNILRKPYVRLRNTFSTSHSAATRLKVYRRMRIAWVWGMFVRRSLDLFVRI